jgi:hypothetical protein
MGSVPKFENDKVVLPLQAADMLAWHIRRHKDHPEEDDSKWPTAPVIGLLHAEVEVTRACFKNRFGLRSGTYV